MRFIQFFIVCIFIFSSMYTMYYYFLQGETSAGTAPEGLNDDANNTEGLNFPGIFDAILEFISWISPFALIKALLIVITPSEIYEILNLLILRPVGWIAVLIESNYIVSKIPTISGE